MPRLNTIVPWQLVHPLVNDMPLGIRMYRYLNLVHCSFQMLYAELSLSVAIIIIIQLTGMVLLLLLSLLLLFITEKKRCGDVL